MDPQSEKDAREAEELAAREEERRQAEAKAKKIAEEREQRRATIADIRERMAEAKKALQQRLDVRASNLEAAKTRLDFNLKALDSSIKKNEALIKKLRMISAENKDSIIKGIQETNMTRFVSESVDAVAEAKLKNSDIPAAVQIISLLHLRYSDFGRLLIGKLSQAFAVPKKEALASETETERKDRLTRRRSTLRLLAELLVSGVLADAGVLLAALRELVAQELPAKELDGGTALVAIVAGFAKYAADDILGLRPQWRVEADLFLESYHRARRPPPPAAADADAPPADADADAAAGAGESAGEAAGGGAAGEEEVGEEEAAERELVAELEAELAGGGWAVGCVSGEQRGAVREVMAACYDALVAGLLGAHEAVRAQERENRRQLASRGDLTDECARAFERVRANFDRLAANTRTLAEALQVGRPWAAV